MGTIMICTREELDAGFTDAEVSAEYQWGDPRRYAPMARRLRAIESAAREVIAADFNCSHMEVMEIVSRLQRLAQTILDLRLALSGGKP